MRAIGTAASASELVSRVAADASGGGLRTALALNAPLCQGEAVRADPIVIDGRLCQVALGE